VDMVLEDLSTGEKLFTYHTEGNRSRSGNPAHQCYYTFSLEESKYVVCMVWDWPIKPKEKKHFEEFTYLPFEGIQVKVPKEYDAVLRSSYGDYMQLPPEEQRVPHHEYCLYRKPEFFESK